MKGAWESMAYVARLGACRAVARVAREGGLRAALTAAFVALATPAFADTPIVSVWYRGSPAGQPRLDDLAAIKALGFTGVTWPGDATAGVPELRRMAEIVGLTVVLRPERRVMRAETTPVPPTHVDLPVSDALASSIPARAWRAVARGARVLSFDHGEPFGTGTTGRGGQTPSWVAPAVAIARQLSANARLVDQLRPGPSVTIEPSVSGVEVVLLDGGASWVIVATNTGAGTQKTEARLPPRTRVRDLDQLDRWHRHGDAQHAAGSALDVRDRGREGAGLHHRESAAIATKDLSPRRSRSTRRNEAHEEFRK